MRILILVSVLAVGFAAAAPVSSAASVPLSGVKLVAEEAPARPVPGITASTDETYLTYYTNSTYYTVASHGGHNGNGGGRTLHADRHSDASKLVQVDLR
jgi:hypothetical protein